MKHIPLFCCLCCCLASFIARAQTEWPQTLTTAAGAILKIYHPQPDSFRDNILIYRSAFSLLEKGKTDPLFGTFQAIATVETDRDDRTVSLLTVKVPVVNLPGQTDAAVANGLRATLETGIPGLEINIPLDELLSSLDVNTEAKKLSQGLSNRPPGIIFATKPSILVVIDGEPRIQMNKDLGMEVVVNTPYTILKHGNSWYLYGGKHWYLALSPTGPYNYYSGSIPPDLSKVQAAIDNADSASGSHTDTAREGANMIADIVVSTVPAELIQSNGDPLYDPIAGTGLLYVSNSNDDIFVDTGSQLFFVLLAGRWYKSSRLTGGWEYVPADALPADFARIPEGSPKDNVLASVAGTDAAREAVLDAQIPQTARIDRKSASAQVTYDGDPKFVEIHGTHLQYAINTPATVIRYKNHFYCVDGGVWFVSDSPFGPWAACTARPDEVDLIPPDYPVYNVKYVYIYDVMPDYVYMGYTPGYLNDFIYGPTIVYGTGFYYAPWWGSFYYPRPWTWGFNMWYNPWYGWCFGYDLGLDWFNLGVGWGWGSWVSDWWGPRSYRPPYVWHHYRGHGLYERDIRRVENVNHINNLYRPRPDVLTKPPAQRIYSDRNGNVYKKDGRGDWQQRDGNQWKNLTNRPAVIQHLDKQEQMHERGQMRIQNFQQMRGGSTGGGTPRPTGGAGRPVKKN